MKKNIGKNLALYPTPLAVVGTMVKNKPNYALVGHLGIIGHDRVMVSLADSHYTNQGIRENHSLTINLVDEKMLAKADYVGCVSGNTTDKSGVFDYDTAKMGAPIIKESPLVMECVVDDIYKTEGFESFICKIATVYAEETILDGKGKINYTDFRPVLFEMPTYKYLRTGDVIGDCMKIN